MMEGNFWR